MSTPIAANDKDFLSSIRCLYDAAMDSEKWPAFLQQLAATFDARGSHIVRVHPREKMLNFSALYGYEDAILKRYGADGKTDLQAALARYEQHFMELMPTDPRVRFLERFPSRPLSCRLEISETELHGSKVYQDMLRIADIEYSLLVSLAEDDGSLIMFGAFRGRGSQHFTKAELDHFSELIPHVKQAISLSEHLARLSFASHVAFDALDSIAMGLLIVDERARLIHSNVVGQRILGLRDGITVSGGALVLHDQEEDTGFREIVRTMMTTAQTMRTPPCQAIAVARPSGREAMPMLLGLLSHHAPGRRPGPLDRPLAVLLVSLPEEPQEAPAELLRRLFGLTLAEARVCERLVQRRTIKDIARDLGIAVDTVRAHLKSVYTKTDTAKQAELVAKIMATPVWIHHRQRRIRGDRPDDLQALS